MLLKCKYKGGFFNTFKMAIWKKCNTIVDLKKKNGTEVPFFKVNNIF